MDTENNVFRLFEDDKRATIKLMEDEKGENHTKQLKNSKQNYERQLVEIISRNKEQI